MGQIPLNSCSVMQNSCPCTSSFLAQLSSRNHDNIFIIQDENHEENRQEKKKHFSAKADMQRCISVGSCSTFYPQGKEQDKLHLSFFAIKIIIKFQHQITPYYMHRGKHFFQYQEIISLELHFNGECVSSLSSIFFHGLRILKTDLLYKDSCELFEKLCAQILFHFFNLFLFVSSSQQSLLRRPQCAMGSLTVKHLESCTVMLNIEKKDKAGFFVFVFLDCFVLFPANGRQLLQGQ